MFIRPSILLFQPYASRLVRSAFPQELTLDVDSVLAVIPVSHRRPVKEESIGPVNISGEEIHIPTRIYSPEPKRRRVNKLGERSRSILSCLYTRHANGYIREKYLRDLISEKQSWIPPFVLQLVGEYVVEIIEVVVANIECVRSDPYFEFIAQNREFIVLTKRRIISYWHRYYRYRCPHFCDYAGFKVFDALNLWNPHDARRLRGS